MDSRILRFKAFYDNGKILRAVDNLSFGIPARECFGLLGTNGAGKTTTFRMLTGDTPMTSGYVTINGLDLSKDMAAVRRLIGYCPQYNGLVDLMTGREMLEFFARLRGVPEDAVKGTAERLIEEFDLTKHADRGCGTYSGGNKRKLSTALALVGDPPIVFLDEPTSVSRISTVVEPPSHTPPHLLPLPSSPSSFHSAPDLTCREWILVLGGSSGTR